MKKRKSRRREKHLEKNFSESFVTMTSLKLVLEEAHDVEVKNERMEAGGYFLDYVSHSSGRQ